MQVVYNAIDQRIFGSTSLHRNGIDEISFSYQVYEDFSSLTLNIFIGKLSICVGAHNFPNADSGLATWNTTLRVWGRSEGQPREPVQ